MLKLVLTHLGSEVNKAVERSYCRNSVVNE